MDCEEETSCENEKKRNNHKKKMKNEENMMKDITIENKEDTIKPINMLLTNIETKHNRASLVNSESENVITQKKELSKSQLGGSGGINKRRLKGGKKRKRKERRQQFEKLKQQNTHKCNARVSNHFSLLHYDPTKESKLNDLFNNNENKTKIDEDMNDIKNQLLSLQNDVNSLYDIMQDNNDYLNSIDEKNPTETNVAESFSIYSPKSNKKKKSDENSSTNKKRKRKKKHQKDNNSRSFQGKENGKQEEKPQPFNLNSPSVLKSPKSPLQNQNMNRKALSPLV
eukprot:TRINITY_DN6005_c1_g1_i1.p1 TRINITY_DN6005_c1_g1~~TRINITY_DN6005_c1_g1_i1.p1  ORF type:complete len:308 (+),score=116.92 TRINITY_DN6005_c1_g1_i1:77-925(+)